MVCGVFAVVFGTLYAFGGAGESVATVVFGLWFLFCLGSALRAIKRRDVRNHRALDDPRLRDRRGRRQHPDLGLRTQRDRAAGMPNSFAVGFWLAFVTHAIVAEWWVRTSPFPRG